MSRYLSGLSALLLLWAGCASPQSDLRQAEEAITPQTIKAHIAVLANDSMRGRSPYSAGEQKAIRYIAAQFKELGLKPGNQGSYFQEVPLVEINSQPSPVMTISGGKSSFDLAFKQDFVAFNAHTQDSVRLENSPLVFAGYGIVAPEYHWNDYAGLDVRGKTVIVLVNDPGFESGDPTFFKGDTMTYYGRWTYKYEEAARQGAAGVLIVHQTKPASYPWSVVSHGFSGREIYLRDSAGPVNNPCKMEGWISEAAARRLLEAAGIQGDFRAVARARGFKPVGLGMTVSLAFHNQVSYHTSHNVVARLDGSLDPAEYVLYSAHWDHLGVGEPVNGDSIYNGAVDNASGVASLLAIAKAFTRLQEKPRRSMVFLAVTAEEDGLLGSSYYATHPIYPLRKTAADLNMDALGDYGETRDYAITGMGQSDLDDYVLAEARSEGRAVRGDLNPGAGSYFRSDHFSFAQVGLPSLDLNTGLEGISADSAQIAAMRDAYWQTHYHAPSDEYSPDMNTSGMAEVADMLFRVGYRLSGEETFPEWKQGSEFKALRDRMMSAASAQ